MWQIVPPPAIGTLKLESKEDDGLGVKYYYLHPPSGSRYLRLVRSPSMLASMRLLARNTGEVVTEIIWYKDVSNEAPERVQGRPLWCFKRDREPVDSFHELVERVLFDLYFINLPASTFYLAMGLSN